MNQFKAWGLAIATTCGGMAFAAETPPSEPREQPSQPWFSRILNPGSPRPEAKSESRPEEPAAKPPLRPSIIIAPLAPEVLAEAVKAEEQACTRRLDACARLRQIAVDQNDDAMLRRIDDLERQIIELCQQRVTRLGVKTDQAVRGASRRVSAESMLNQELGMGAAVDPLTVAQPVPAARTATAEARGVRP